MATELSAAGCRVTDRAGPADAFIINTCAVTHVAERKARHLVRFARRLSPRARIIVTGCYAETAAAESLYRLGADAVVGNRDKQRAAGLLLQDVASREAAGAANRLRTRSFVKIQEGCNDVCAFCVVPRTRGRERSVPAAEILRALRSVEADGVKEVVLTGTQLGAYGRDREGDVDLVGLLRLVLEETSIPRIRLSSLQPQDVAPALLDLWEDPRLCRHFHIALQSGSDAVLARMRRRYTTREFGRALDAIRETASGRRDHNGHTRRVPRRRRSGLRGHVSVLPRGCFRGAARFPVLGATRDAGGEDAGPGTRADETGAGAGDARFLGKSFGDAFWRAFEGSVAGVLFEKRARDKGENVLAWEGLTGNYIRVLAPSDQRLENRVLPVRLERRRDGGFWGELQSLIDVS